MKILIKKISIILLTIFMLVGCGSKEVSVEKTALGLYEAQVNFKYNNLAQLDSEEKIKIFEEKTKEIIKSKILRAYSKMGMSETALDEATNTYVLAMNKLTKPIIEVSDNDEVKNVVYKFNALDFSFLETFQYDIEKMVKNGKTEEEINSYCEKEYENQLNNIKLYKEQKILKAEFTKQLFDINGKAMYIYYPKDYEQFTNDFLYELLDI